MVRVIRGKVDRSGNRGEPSSYEGEEESGR
jgi:hypothetical protein